MPCDNAKTSSDIEHVDWNSGQHYANVRWVLNALDMAKKKESYKLFKYTKEQKKNKIKKEKREIK